MPSRSPLSLFFLDKGGGLSEPQRHTLICQSYTWDWSNAKKWRQVHKQEWKQAPLSPWCLWCWGARRKLNEYSSAICSGWISSSLWILHDARLRDRVWSKRELAWTQTGRVSLNWSERCKHSDSLLNANERPSSAHNCKVIKRSQL